MENKINVQLNFDTHQLTDDMVRKILPAMHGIAAQIEQRLHDEIQRVGYQAWLNRRQQFGGAVQ